MKIKNSIECWIFANNQVLLLEVDQGEDHPNFLQPVTGGIEAGESNMIACCREVYEETGLQIKSDQLDLVIKDYEVYIPKEQLRIMKDIFVLRLVRQFELRISDEHVGYRWVNSTEVRTQLYWDSNKETYELIERHVGNFGII